MAHILLLAEPSLTIQRVVQLTFANEDIDVVVASDGAEAIEQAERLRPSVVLADVALARVNGYDLAAHFKRHPRFAGVPVVLLAGAFERVDSERATASGCDLVLSKPFEPRHLLAHVKELLPGGQAHETVADVPVASATRAAPAGFTSGALDALPSSRRGPASVPEPPPSIVTEQAPESAATMFTLPPVDEFIIRVPPKAAPAPAIPDPVPPPQVAAPVVPESWPVPAPAPPPPAAPVPPAPPVERASAPVIPAGLPPVLADWMRPEPVEASKARRPADPVAEIEPVPSFEMLALTNKAMRLVPPPSVQDEPDAGPGPVESPQEPVQEGRFGNDLGDLIPSLDDYFDQLDAAFAAGGDNAFRRLRDAIQPPAPPQETIAPPAPSPLPPPPPPLPPPVPAPARQESLMPPPPVPPDRRKPAPPAPDPVETRAPAISPFSTLRLEPPGPQPAPPSVSATIDDAYDALMKQLQEPKQRPSVVALRADDELLVERAVERVLAQLDTAALREAMADVVTNLTKKVIAEEVGRIRRP